MSIAWAYPGLNWNCSSKDADERRGASSLTQTPGFPVSLERRVGAVAIADQVGAAHRLQLRSA
jgi:hypothetical protein